MGLKMLASKANIFSQKMHRNILVIPKRAYPILVFCLQNTAIIKFHVILN